MAWKAASRSPVGTGIASQGPSGKPIVVTPVKNSLGTSCPPLTDPASVGEIFLHGRGRAGTRLGRCDPGGHLELVGAPDRLAHVARQAIGGDDAEPDTGDDADANSLGLLVEVVEGAEYLQLVADVEVVDSCAQAGPGEWGGGVEERPGGVQHQVHIAQSRLQGDWIIQVQNPVR